MRRTTEPPKRLRGTVERKDGTVAKRMTVYLDPQMAKRLHQACIEDETNMSAVIGVLVEGYLVERGRRER